MPEFHYSVYNEALLQERTAYFRMPAESKLLPALVKKEKKITVIRNDSKGWTEEAESVGER